MTALGMYSEVYLPQLGLYLTCLNAVSTPPRPITRYCSLYKPPPPPTPLGLPMEHRASR